ncbi:GyrI-like domain-containing protein [Akkermansia sp.]|uniref:GyrI-like domain-containing protein n=1 Tax=Akkermansia sp. TaxID=1872421 RepID=UPI0025C12B2F|nr:GyrI-like domain-containing protein [Akkermansia sp.]MCC8149795.1 GyrI-like domain-containing protein [Akkermansia sp.]
MPPLDFKKEDKHLYQPPAHPVLVDVPEMIFFMVDGEGNPNDPAGAYQHAIELLYALSYAVRMGGKKGAFPVPDYREYVVPPLEGLWWNCNNPSPSQKKDFRWISMIRQPGFVTPETLSYAQEQVGKKKPHLNVAAARLASFREGLCVQCLHTGPYDEEPATLAQMHSFMEREGLLPDMDGSRAHHEIYLSDPRKTSPERLKTVLRLPARRR